MSTMDEYVWMLSKDFIFKVQLFWNWFDIWIRSMRCDWFFAIGCQIDVWSCYFVNGVANYIVTYVVDDVNWMLICLVILWISFSKI